MFKLICVIAACATTYYLCEAKSDYDDLKTTRKQNAKPESTQTSDE